MQNHLLRSHQGCSFGCICRLITCRMTSSSSLSVVCRSPTSASRIAPAAVLYASRIARPIFCIASKVLSTREFCFSALNQTGTVLVLASASNQSPVVNLTNLQGTNCCKPKYVPHITDEYNQVRPQY